MCVSRHHPCLTFVSSVSMYARCQVLAVRSQAFWQRILHSPLQPASCILQATCSFFCVTGMPRVAGPCPWPRQRRCLQASELRREVPHDHGARSTHPVDYRRYAGELHTCPCGSGSDLASIAATMSGDTEARPNEARPTFVSPRTLLEQARPILPPRTFTALDREQLDGLVRLYAQSDLLVHRG